MNNGIEVSNVKENVRIIEYFWKKVIKGVNKRNNFQRNEEDTHPQHQLIQYMLKRLPKYIY